MFELHGFVAFDDIHACWVAVSSDGLSECLQAWPSNTRLLQISVKIRSDCRCTGAKMPISSPCVHAAIMAASAMPMTVVLPHWRAMIRIIMRTMRKLRQFCCVSSACFSSAGLSSSSRRMPRNLKYSALNCAYWSGPVIFGMHTIIHWSIACIWFFDSVIFRCSHMMVMFRRTASRRRMPSCPMVGALSAVYGWAGRRSRSSIARVIIGTNPILYLFGGFPITATSARRASATSWSRGTASSMPSNIVASLLGFTLYVLYAIINIIRCCA